MTPVRLSLAFDVFREVMGEIIWMPMSFGGGPDHIVGRFRCYLYNATFGANHGLSGAEALDKFSYLPEEAQEVYGDGNAFHPTVSAATGDELQSSNMLAIDRLELLPEFRGLSLSYLVVKSIVESLSDGLGLVLLCMSPLQHLVGAGGLIILHRIGRG